MVSFFPNAAAADAHSSLSYMISWPWLEHWPLEISTYECLGAAGGAVVDLFGSHSRFSGKMLQNNSGATPFWHDKHAMDIAIQQFFGGGLVPREGADVAFRGPLAGGAAFILQMQTVVEYPPPHAVILRVSELTTRYPRYAGDGGPVK